MPPSRWFMFLIAHWHNEVPCYIEALQLICREARPLKGPAVTWKEFLISCRCIGLPQWSSHLGQLNGSVSTQNFTHSEQRNPKSRGRNGRIVSSGAHLPPSNPVAAQYLDYKDPTTSGYRWRVSSSRSRRNINRKLSSRRQGLFVNLCGVNL